MLVGNSLPEYVFTRVAVWGLRSVAPISIIFCSCIVYVAPLGTPLSHPWLIPPYVWMVGEAAFYLGCYLPLRRYFQRPVVHPPPPSKAEREVLFQRIRKNITEPNSYISKWFMNARIEDIKWENLKQFFSWSLMNRRYGLSPKSDTYESIDNDQDQELNGYLELLEQDFGRWFDRGLGKAKCLRGTFDEVLMQHRPLLWYGIVLLVDVTSSLRLACNSYTLYRQAGLAPLAMLPQRWHTLFARRTSPSPSLSYWYREHTSKTRLPVLFVHGIGIGIFAYVDFLNSLAAESSASQEEDDGQVGIIALELMSISSRICAPALDSEEMKGEISKILDAHGWVDFVLASHSYGTAIASNMLRNPAFSGRIKAAVLMDPICIMLSLPDVAFNFTRRKPTQANERMLYYFASQDMLISHTLARHFFWSEYILWEEDFADLPITVTLSGRDLIVPKEAVWQYLTGSDIHETSMHADMDDDQRTRQFEKGNLKVFWFDEFDHAGLFASKGACRGIARRTIEYCSEETSAGTLA